MNDIALMWLQPSARQQIKNATQVFEHLPTADRAYLMVAVASNNYRMFQQRIQVLLGKHYTNRTLRPLLSPSRTQFGTVQAARRSIALFQWMSAGYITSQQLQTMIQIAWHPTAREKADLDALDNLIRMLSGEVYDDKLARLEKELALASGPRVRYSLSGQERYKKAMEAIEALKTGRKGVPGGATLSPYGPVATNDARHFTGIFSKGVKWGKIRSRVYNLVTFFNLVGLDLTQRFGVVGQAPDIIGTYPFPNPAGYVRKYYMEVVKNEISKFLDARIQPAEAVRDFVTLSLLANFKAVGAAVNKALKEHASRKKRRAIIRGVLMIIVSIVLLVFAPAVIASVYELGITIIEAREKLKIAKKLRSAAKQFRKTDAGFANEIDRVAAKMESQAAEAGVTEVPDDAVDKKIQALTPAVEAAVEKNVLRCRRALAAGYVDTGDGILVKGTALETEDIV